MKVTNFILKG